VEVLDYPVLAPQRASDVESGFSTTDVHVSHAQTTVGALPWTRPEQSRVKPDASLSTWANQTLGSWIHVAQHQE
jgi:hypothetical protein